MVDKIHDFQVAELTASKLWCMSTLVLVRNEYVPLLLSAVLPVLHSLSQCEQRSGQLDMQHCRQAASGVVYTLQLLGLPGELTVMYVHTLQLYGCSMHQVNPIAAVTDATHIISHKMLQYTAYQGAHPACTPSARQLMQ